MISRMASIFSGGTGSSSHISFSGSRSRARRMALCLSSRVWRSVATSTDGPAASTTISASSHHAVMLPVVGSHVELVLLVPAGLAAGVAVGADVEIDLERGEAGFEHLVDHRLDLGHVHAGRDLAVAVDADLVAELAAQQLVDRHLQRLALQIPERDLDAGQRGDQRAGEAALEDEAAAQFLEDRVDGEGIAADQLVRQLAG